MDRAVDPTAALERRVGSVDDRVDVELRDIGTPRFDLRTGDGEHWHERCMRGATV